MIASYEQHLKIRACQLRKRAQWKAIKAVFSCMRIRCITKRHLRNMMIKAVAHWTSVSNVATFFAWVNITKSKKKLCQTVGTQAWAQLIGNTQRFVHILTCFNHIPLKVHDKSTLLEWKYALSSRV